MITEQIKSRANFKLTISGDEMRIKMPEDSTVEERIEMVDFFKRVKKEVGTPEFTLRGGYSPKTKSLRLTGQGNKVFGVYQKD
jgi:hypothetical protein